MNSRNSKIKALVRVLFIVVAIAITGNYQEISRADVSVGEGVTRLPVTHTMASLATLSVTIPTVSTAAVGQVATIPVHVSLLWPEGANVEVKSQDYDSLDCDEGVVSISSVPEGYGLSLEEESHAGSISCAGGENNTVFDFSVNINYSIQGAKTVPITGRVEFADGSILICTPISIVETSGGTATIVAENQILPPQFLLKDVTVRQFVQALYYLVATKNITVLQGGKILLTQSWKVAVAGGATTTVILAAGLYAAVDGVWYYKTGKSIGPFTTLGRYAADLIDNINPPQIQIAAPPPPIVILSLTVDEIIEIAKERAKRKGTKVCDELQAMRYHFLVKGASFHGIVTNVLIAIGSEGCGAPPAEVGNQGGQQDAKHRDIFQEHYHLTNAQMSNLWVHHAVEQQIMDIFPGVFTWAEIQSWQNLRGIPIIANGVPVNRRVHLSQIRVIWNKFYKKYTSQGKIPSKQEVLDQASLIDQQFGDQLFPHLR